jgi:predicted nucleic-acid-binding Zn-ribbon protein
VTGIKKLHINCPKCGYEMQPSITGFFYPKEIIMLRIFGGLLIAGFFYLILFTSFGFPSGSGGGRFVVFFPILIVALILKIGKQRQEVRTCTQCGFSDTNK